MNLLKILYSSVVIILIIVTNIDALKVIYVKNATAAADISRIGGGSELKIEEIDKSTIINVPGNCKPGYIYEAKRCRKVAS